jgi:hypothetical protein
LWVNDVASLVEEAVDVIDEDGVVVTERKLLGGVHPDYL